MYLVPVLVMSVSYAMILIKLFCRTQPGSFFIISDLFHIFHFISQHFSFYLNTSLECQDILPGYVSVISNMFLIPTLSSNYKLYPKKTTYKN